MANERLIFLACNIYSILADIAFIAVHSGERCGRWASGLCNSVILRFLGRSQTSRFLLNVRSAILNNDRQTKGKNSSSYDFATY